MSVILPLASTSVAGINSTGTQSIAGNKTFATALAETVTTNTTTGTISDLAWTTGVLRFTTPSAVTLNGVVAPVDGTKLTIINDGNNAITIPHATGTVNNSFVTPTSGSITIPGNGSLTFVYSGSRWRVSNLAQFISSTATTFTFNGTGGTSGSVTLRYQRIGDWVTLAMPAVSATTGTGSTNFTSNTAIDSLARPATSSQTFVVMELINGGSVIAAVGYGVVTINGNIQILRDAVGTAFTNAANAGTNRNQVFSYYVGSGS